MNHPPLEVKVWGDYACFTRPEMKVERVSYPVMTPSAARGILEAIFWKPEFYWRVREIWVMKEIRFASILRNEVNDKISLSSAKSETHYFADESKNRAQRHSLILQDAAYIIKADVAVKPGVDEDQAKFRDMFRRRVNRGQSFHRPYMGCREFAASFGNTNGDENPIQLTEELGLMLFDQKYKRDENGKGIGGEPIFFTAKLDNGILQVPQELCEEVL